VNAPFQPPLKTTLSPFEKVGKKIMRVNERKLLFSPPGKDWARTHAQNPFGQTLGNGRMRVHFASRDEKNRSQGASLDLSIDQLTGAEALPPQFPAMSLGLGKLGCFDDCGVMPSAIVEHERRHYLFYTGWTLARTVPFAFHIGAAVSEDGGRSFHRISEAPVLGRNRYDPYITGAPWVIIESGVFRMWYISGTSWEATGDAAKHYYTIKYAESADGIAWRTSDHLCIPYGPGEYALARPVVFREGGVYEMLFSYRADGGTYSVGRAVSPDGISWKRDAGPLLAPSVEGWDSEMICYAWPFQSDGAGYLLYNGNNYGNEGFGVIRIW
jgi:hypothetical protein